MIASSPSRPSSSASAPSTTVPASRLANAQVPEAFAQRLRLRRRRARLPRPRRRHTLGTLTTPIESFRVPGACGRGDRVFVVVVVVVGGGGPRGGSRFRRRRRRARLRARPRFTSGQGGLRVSARGTSRRVAGGCRPRPRLRSRLGVGVPRLVWRARGRLAAGRLLLPGASERAGGVPSNLILVDVPRSDANLLTHGAVGSSRRRNDTLGDVRAEPAGHRPRRGILRGTHDRLRAADGTRTPRSRVSRFARFGATPTTLRDPSDSTLRGRPRPRSTRASEDPHRARRRRHARGSWEDAMGETFALDCCSPAARLLV